MSYIFEALKKSERDRRAQNRAPSPSPLEARYAEPPRGKGLRAGILGLIVLFALVISYFWIRPQANTATNAGTAIKERAIVIPDKAESLTSRHTGKQTQDTGKEKQKATELSYASLPFTWELPSEMKASFADMKVTIHIYGAGSNPHMLYINNHEYRIGDQIREGARIERITPEGVLLSARGYFFKLPRPR